MDPILLGAGALFLLGRGRKGSSSSSSSSDAGASSTPASSPATKPGASTASNLGKIIGTIGSIGTAVGAGAGAAVGAAAVIGGGAVVGYEMEGIPGAIVGALNPAGAVGTVGFRAAHDAAKAAGATPAAADAAGASGGLLFTIATIGDIATAVALLPTVAIVVGLTELISALFGSSTPDPTPGQQVDFLYQMASNPVLPLSNDQRVQAAAQLVALGNGVAMLPASTLGGFTVPAHPNPFRDPARTRAAQLGLSSLLE